MHCCVDCDPKDPVFLCVVYTCSIQETNIMAIFNSIARVFIIISLFTLVQHYFSMHYIFFSIESGVTVVMLLYWYVDYSYQTWGKL